MNNGKKEHLCAECWTSYEHAVDEEGHLILGARPARMEHSCWSKS